MIGQEVDFLFREWLKHSHGNTNQYIQKVIFLGVFYRVSGFHLKHSRRCAKLQKVSVWQFGAVSSCGTVFPWHTPQRPEDAPCARTDELECRAGTGGTGNVQGLEAALRGYSTALSGAGQDVPQLLSVLFSTGRIRAVCPAGREQKPLLP